MYDIESLRKQVKKVLVKNRYEHTIGVMYTAASLAMCYDLEVDKAMVAGLLHDCAKSIPHDEKYQLCDKHGIQITNFERDNPELIHAKLGAFLASEIYQVQDIEIRNAISNHTTGCPNMTLLDKIIFLSDYIEPGRHQLPQLQYIRKMTFNDMDEALYTVLGSTLQYLSSSGKLIDPMTEEAYEYYKQQFM